tara:strand:+ start:130 stop:330 length:201 start_codon:yes stop_codon:yes gene_type:complete
MKGVFVRKIEKKRHAVISLWDDTKKLADAEKKTPVVVLCQKNRKGFWIVAHEKDLDKVIKAKKQEE